MINSLTGVMSADLSFRRKLCEVIYMKKFIQSIHFCGVFEDSDANAVGIIATKLSDENLNFKIFIDNTADAVSGTGDYAHIYTFEILLSQATMMHDATAFLGNIKEPQLMFRSSYGSLTLCSCIKPNRNRSPFVQFTFNHNFAMMILHCMLYNG